MATAPVSAAASAVAAELGCSAGCSAQCRRERRGGAQSAVAAPPATKSRPFRGGLPRLVVLAFWWGSLLLRRPFMWLLWSDC